ncbi:hypothetical protein [Syntrophomonas palmitatica]|uniref:hypothetical protein n=1 Tax=Syntrophomonas palmitatica TaxID=402877 RepID=UPI0012EE4A32|nr:hypothetical protein [Syntrophomonas palmitatica]
MASLDALIAKNSDRLADPIYLQQLNQETDKRFLMVLVEKDGQFVYIPKHIDAMGLRAATVLQENNRPPDHHGYMLLKYRDFTFSDQKNGHIFFLTQTKPPGPLKILYWA